MERPGRKSVRIIDCVTSFVIDGNTMLGLMDPRVQGKFDIDSARKAVTIVESCTRKKKKEMSERPDIREVLTELKGSLPRELGSEIKWEEGKLNEQLGTTSSEFDPAAGAMAK